MNEKYNNLIKQRDKAEKKIEQADFKARQSKYYESQKKQLSQFKTLILSEIYQVSQGYFDRFFALKWGYINDARMTGLLI